MRTPGSSCSTHSVTSRSLALLMETEALEEVVVLDASMEEHSPFTPAAGAVAKAAG